MNKAEYKRVDHLLRTWRSKQISESRGQDARMALDDYPECWISQVRSSRFLVKGNVMNRFEPLFIPLRNTSTYKRNKQICTLYSHCKFFGAIPESRYLEASNKWNK